MCQICQRIVDSKKLPVMVKNLQLNGKSAHSNYNLVISDFLKILGR